MKSVPQVPFDPVVMQRRHEGFAATAQRQLALLPARTLYELRPRDGLFTAAAAAAALGLHLEARRMLGCIARLADASLTVGGTASAVTIRSDWPEAGATVVTQGPADPVGPSDWLFAFSAAMVADDAEAERALLSQRTFRAAAGVRVDLFWVELVEAWAKIAAGDVGGAGAPLVRALQLTDPDHTLMSADQVLCVVVPIIELMLPALDRDQPGFDAAIVKGLERLNEFCTATGDMQLPHLPLHLLAAVRLGLRRGLALQVSSPVLEVLTAPSA